MRNTMKTCCNYNLICIIISCWTLVQTSLHLVLIVYGYYMKICAEKPKAASTIFFYLTYLYDGKCGKLDIKSSEASPLEDFFSIIFNMIASAEERDSLTTIVSDILMRAQLPKHSDATSKTYHYFVGFMILDSSWIVSSVALLMASSCRIKEKASLFFYGPWLLTTICTMLFDTAATVHFGLDLSETINFHNWVKFVGILNPQDLTDLELLAPSKRLPTYPTISIMLLTSRGAIIWIINLISLLLVYKAAKMAYRQTYRTERPTNPLSAPSTVSPSGGGDASTSRITRNTSEDRIKSWQLFYGAVESTSSSQDDDQNVLGIDINSNKDERKVSSATYVISPPQTATTSSGFYYAYSDVADGLSDGSSDHNNVFMEELRGQKPWSYFANEKNVDELTENVNTKRIRIKSADSAISGTAL